MSKPKTQPSPAELERQKNAFIQKLVEIQRKRRKQPKQPHQSAHKVSR